MENKIKRSWGFVSLAVVLFVFTAVVTLALGQKTSMHYIVWLIVGWYGYKGNIEAIRTTTKFSMWINIGLIVFTFLFIGNNEYEIVLEIKKKLAISQIILLVPTLIIYLYCNSELKEITTKSVGEVKSQHKNEPFENKREIMQTEQKNTNNVIVNEVDAYEFVADEFESEKRKKGLYAKLFAETNGDETQIRVLYYKVSVFKWFETDGLIS